MAFSQPLETGQPARTGQLFSLDPSNDDDENMTDDSSDGADQSSGLTNSVKKSRNTAACLSCRRQKTRCEYADDEEGLCKLCVKYNRECIRAPPRRRRQKTTVRIADLEQKIQNLTDALIEKPNGAKGHELPPPGKKNPEMPLMARWPGSRKTAPFGTELKNEEPTSNHLRDVDIIDKGLVDKITAYAAFERCRTKMLPIFAFMTIPSEIGAEQYRRKKPLLFSVIVLTGVAAIRPELLPKAAEDLSRTFGDRVMHRGDRSLELVQSLTLFVSFYSRSLQKRDLNFYQYIHIACTMALDLGLGRRISHNGPSRLKISADEQLEARRAWLGCYYMSINAAICLRHPPFIRWSPYIEECLDVLSTHPQTVTSDIYVCDVVRITRIMEDASNMFSMDDPGCVVSLKDPKTQYQLGALERQLQQWRQSSKSDMSSPESRSSYAAANLYIHEIALHSDHDIDKFKSPPVLDEVTESLQNLDIAPVRIDALCICLESAHELFDIALGLSVDTIRFFPNLFLVRIGYAAMILQYLSDIFDSNARENARSKAIDVKFDYFVNKTIRLLAEVGDNGKSNIGSAFAAVLTKIKQMHDARRASALQTTREMPLSAVTSHSGLDQPGVSISAPTYTIPSEDAPNNAYYSSHQQPLPTEFNFNDFDTNMFDINAFQTFDPNFNLYDFSGMYVENDGSVSAGT